MLEPSAKVMTIGSEAELLLCCTRTSINLETAKRVKTLIKKDLDWDHLIKTAKRNGVLPLLYWSLSTICPDAVPEITLNRLQDHFHTNVARNLSMTAELLKLLAMFRVHNILAIPYKGPALAVFAYGNLALREFVDLDILVKERNLPEARELLIAYGYRLIYRYGVRQLTKLTDRQEAAYIKSYHEYEFIRHDGLVAIDLHWRLAPRKFPFILSMDELWNNLIQISLAGTMVFGFALEPLVLLLCMHGAKDRWKKLAWVSDIDHLLSLHKEIDWEMLISQARMLHCERILFLGLFLAHDMLGTSLPQDVLRLIQSDASIISTSRSVGEKFFEDRPKAPEFLEFFGMSWLHIKVFSRWHDKCRYIFRALITPSTSEWSRLALPDNLFAAYYVLRPLRIASKIAKTLWKHGRR